MILFWEFFVFSKFRMKNLETRILVYCPMSCGKILIAQWSRIYFHSHQCQSCPAVQFLHYSKFMLYSNPLIVYCHKFMLEKLGPKPFNCNCFWVRSVLALCLWSVLVTGGNIQLSLLSFSVSSCLLSWCLHWQACSGDSDVVRPCILVSILMPPAKSKGALIDLKSSGQGKTLLMILWIWVPLRDMGGL